MVKEQGTTLFICFGVELKVLTLVPCVGKDMGFL